MEFGAYVFPTDYSMPPGEFAKEAEDRGFDALMFPEHTHIPASRQTPFPGGGDLPMEYSHTLDPFVALTAAAMATKTLKIGTGICLVVERDPIQLAKEVATLDLFSGGRLRFGIGGGWNREEMENHGTEYGTRWSLMRERIEAMKAIWTQDEASYHGKFVNFERIWAEPKPMQKPHPPILIGGSGERTLQRVIRYGDEWMPIGQREESLGPRIRELQAMAAEAGRAPIPVSIFGVPTQAKMVAMHQKDGVYGCYFPVPPAARDKALPRLDRIMELRREFEGAGA